MDPASSNPPVEPVISQPQEIPVVPPETPVAPINPIPVTPPVPEKSATNKTVLTIAIVILVIAVLAALAYFLGLFSSGKEVTPQTLTEVPTPVTTSIQTPIATVSAAPVASASASTQGTVAGKLCYPSEVAPAGEIDAKDKISGKTYKQNFVGTAAGGSLSYTFPLVPGTYHLKYQTSATMAGYYTLCAQNPTSVVCAQDVNHKNLDVVVTAGKTVAGVDLCDFYWNQTQKAALDASF